MNKEELTLLDFIQTQRSEHSEGGVSIVLYAGKIRLETDMAEVYHIFGSFFILSDFCF